MIIKEEVGRKWTATRYGVHCRRIDGDGKWYGLNNHKTRAEAEAALAKLIGNNRYEILPGGLVLDFGTDDGVRYERRIVRVDMAYETLAVSTPMMKETQNHFVKG